MARGADGTLSFARSNGTGLTAPYMSPPNIRAQSRGSPNHDPPPPPPVPRAPVNPTDHELDQLARRRIRRLIHQRDAARVPA